MKTSQFLALFIRHAPLALETGLGGRRKKYNGCFLPKKARELFRFSPFYAPILSIYGLKFLSQIPFKLSPFHRSGRAEEISRRGRGTLIYVFGALSCLSALKCSRGGKEEKEGEKCRIEGPRTSPPPVILWGGLERVSHDPWVFVLYHRQFAFCRFGDFFRLRRESATRLIRRLWLDGRRQCGCV